MAHPFDTWPPKPPENATGINRDFPRVVYHKEDGPCIVKSQEEMDAKLAEGYQKEVIGHPNENDRHRQAYLAALKEPAKSAEPRSWLRKRKKEQ